MTRGERREPEGTRVPPIYRAVCSAANDAADARMLLSALGLEAS